MKSSAATLLMASLIGCATTSNVAGVAPHSSVSRGEALTLAKHVAGKVGGRVYAIAPSGSMLPTLDESSIVTIEEVSLDRLKTGDIVVYRNAAGLAVIHRLYERHGDLWFVLGDNNPSVDRETVSAENLLGRVCAIFYTTSAGTRVSAATAVAPPTAVASAQ